jgi:hypothetical protein
MKKKYKTYLLVVLTTTLQYFWFLPRGKSCSDPIEDNIWLPLLPVLFLMLILTFLIKRFSKKYLVFKNSLLLVGFWLLSNYLSFHDRVSCWTTYLFYEEFSEVFYLSLFPITICLAIFMIGNFYFEKLMMGDKIKHFNPYTL